MKGIEKDIKEVVERMAKLPWFKSLQESAILKLFHKHTRQSNIELLEGLKIKAYASVRSGSLIECVDLSDIQEEIKNLKK